MKTATLTRLCIGLLATSWIFPPWHTPSTQGKITTYESDGFFPVFRPLAWQQSASVDWEALVLIDIAIISLTLGMRFAGRMPE